MWCDCVLFLWGLFLPVADSKHILSSISHVALPCSYRTQQIYLQRRSLTVNLLPSVSFCPDLFEIFLTQVNIFIYLFFCPPRRPSLCPRCFDGRVNSCIAAFMRTTSRLARPWEPPSRAYASQRRIIFIIPSVLRAEMKVKILHLTPVGKDGHSFPIND